MAQSTTPLALLMPLASSAPNVFEIKGKETYSDDLEH